MNKTSLSFCLSLYFSFQVSLLKFGFLNASNTGNNKLTSGLIPRENERISHILSPGWEDECFLQLEKPLSVIVNISRSDVPEATLKTVDRN